MITDTEQLGAIVLRREVEVWADPSGMDGLVIVFHNPESERVARYVVYREDVEVILKACQAYLERNKPL